MKYEYTEKPVSEYTFVKCGFLYRKVKVVQYVKYSAAALWPLYCAPKEIGIFKSMNEAKLYVKLIS